MHTVVRVEGPDLLLRPAPVAMVWYEPGRPHEALAAPGVRLSPGEALVEVELATVCGSDVHTTRGDRPAPAPLVLGHEQVGRVVAVGDGAVRADGSPLELGDRVVWSVAVSCGECDRCLRGLEQKCRSLAKYGHERVHRGWELSGGFATHVQLRSGTAVVRVSEQLPALVAAPASCATATAMAALDAAAAHVPLAGSAVLVTGGGMIGLSVAAIAREAGAEVIVSEPDASRRLLARRLGAIAVDPRAARGSVEHLDTVREQLAARGIPELLVAVEASGAAPAVAAAIAAVGVGGVAVLVGSVSPGSELRVDPERIVRGLLTITGVHNYTGVQLERAVAFLERSWMSLPLDELVGITHGLDELDRALAEAAIGEYVRVGVAPGRRPVPYPA